MDDIFDKDFIDRVLSDKDLVKRIRDVFNILREDYKKTVIIPPTLPVVIPIMPLYKLTP